jgi:hypothetical protein
MLSPAEAEEALRELSIDRVIWRLVRTYLDPGPGQSPYAITLLAEPPTAGVIIGAERTPGGEVIVSVSPLGDPAARPPDTPDCR